MDDTLTCHPLEAPYYGSVMNGWIEPLTCHPLEAPLLWLSHEWMD